MSIIYELSRKPKKKTASHARVPILHTKSEDLLTGNVFGILKNLSWSFGLKPFLESVTSNKFPESEFENVEFYFWNRVPTKRDKEGSTEVDLIIELKSILIFIEAKYGAEASKSTTNEKDRNQVIRNLELGRCFVTDSNQEKFHLIYITPDKTIPDIAANYNKESDFSWTNWDTVAKTLRDNIEHFTESEKRLAGDLIDYLVYKGFHDQPYSHPEDRMKIKEKKDYMKTLTHLSEEEKASLRKIMELHNLDLLRNTHYFFCGEGFSLRTINPKKTIFQFTRRKFTPIESKIHHIHSLEEYVEYRQNKC